MISLGFGTMLITTLMIPNLPFLAVAFPLSAATMILG